MNRNKKYLIFLVFLIITIFLHGKMIELSRVCKITGSSNGVLGFIYIGIIIFILSYVFIGVILGCSIRLLTEKIKGKWKLDLMKFMITAFPLLVLLLVSIYSVHVKISVMNYITEETISLCGIFFGFALVNSFEKQHVH